MPDPNALKLVLGKNVQDLSKIRIPGLNKPFEQLTISELTQLRPGSDAADTYEINAVTDNVSVTTSALLNELGKVASVSEMRKELVRANIKTIRGTTPR